MKWGLLMLVAFSFAFFLFYKQTTSATAIAAYPALQEEPVYEKVKVVKSWKMPAVLKEISGIDYLDKDRFVAIQDEKGSLFIFNTEEKEIEREIPFGEVGDYEGVAIAGDDAYVIRSDGQLYQVKNFKEAKPIIKTFKLPFTQKEDIESLAADMANNQLLIAVKEVDKLSSKYKGVYAFDLATLKMKKAPVFKIELGHEVFKKINAKSVAERMQPSDIAIQPATGELYVLEGTNPKLLVMDGTTKKALITLDEKTFPQPEGMTISPDGKLFIASEGKKGPGIIAQVELK